MRRHADDGPGTARMAVCPAGGLTQPSGVGRVVTTDGAPGWCGPRGWLTVVHVGAGSLQLMEYRRPAAAEGHRDAFCPHDPRDDGRHRGPRVLRPRSPG